MKIKFIFLTLTVLVGMGYNGLFAQRSLQIDDAYYYDIKLDTINVIPGQVVTTFYDSIKFRIKAEHQGHVNWDSISAYFYNETESGTYPIGTFYNRTNEDSAISIIPSANLSIQQPPLLYEEPVSYELRYGLNQIYAIITLTHGTETVTYDEAIPILINHPEPAVEAVNFIEIEPNTIIPGTAIELFNDSIYFRADVNYNDDLSIGEDMCLEVYRIFEGGAPILVGEYSNATQGGTNNLVIDDSGEKIKVTLGDLGSEYGQHEIYLKAWFCDFSTEPVVSQSIIINHP
nr:hypothetical protein [Bacteroidota bacterium]